VSTITETVSTDGKILRNFRNSADVENFYRFVHENDLRREAGLIMSTIVKALKNNEKKTKRKRKAKAKKIAKVQ
jgi:riboflavin biosynthesis pyrimidine reductase